MNIVICSYPFSPLLEYPMLGQLFTARLDNKKAERDVRSAFSRYLSYTAMILSIVASTYRLILLLSMILLEVHSLV
jgi:hypothetical protein